MNEYQQLAGQFQRVRRAWKRAAVLSGAAIVIGETIGLLSLLLLLDWVYQPLPPVRVGMWILALGAVGYFLARHVLAPLLRNISDEQIALYIEERRSDLDGVLITAAEYGKGSRSEKQAALIEGVLKHAVASAGRTRLTGAVDLSRLKKYGVLAVAGLTLYTLLGLLFPHSIGHRVARVLQPWQPTVEDLPTSTAETAPIVFSLSRGDTSLPRGSSYEFEATLSRPAAVPVLLSFRPLDSSGEWQQLPMTEIEKLNGFAGVLPDISESIEFFVETGEDKSPTHRISVYDPLAIEKIETAIQYPAYANLPDSIESPSTGDVEALQGSKVSIRIIGNSALKSGRIQWKDGGILELTVDPAAANCATGTFQVNEDTHYEFSVTDANGQQAASSSPLFVRAIPDAPPKLTVKTPAASVLTHRLGEIAFDAEVSDDFGVSAVELVCVRLDPTGKPVETRAPLMVSQPGTDGTLHATHLLALENAMPPPMPEEVITYHIEACDSKGQKAVSEIGLITIGYFEAWATWNVSSPVAGGGGAETGPDLLAMLKAVWDLDGQKQAIAPADFALQSEQLADQMTNKQGGGLRDFVDLKRFPQLAPVAHDIMRHAGNARDALNGADTGKASLELRTAAAIAEGGKLLENVKITRNLNQQTPSAQGYQSAAAPMLTMLEATRLEALNQAEKSKAESGGTDAAEAAKTVSGLLAKQEDILAKIKQAKGPPGAGVADAQRSLAEQTKAAAVKDNAKAGAAGKSLIEAADVMSRAAKDLAAGRSAEAEAAATKAKGQLQIALDALQNNRRDRLEQAISQAEMRTAALLAQQTEVRKQTETVAAGMGGGAPDQRQGRDLQNLAVRQTELRGEAEALNREINELMERAKQAALSNAARSLEGALKTIRRTKVENKMGNAIVDLSRSSPAPAAQEQVKAEDGLKRLLEDLRTSGDGLAASRDAQIRRAARTAAEAKNAAGKLSPDQPGKAHQAANQPGKADQAANQPGKADQAANQPGKADQAANQPGKADQAANQQGKADQAANQPGKVDQVVDQPLSEADRNSLAQSLAHNIGRLAYVLDKRDLVSQEEIERLKELDSEELAKRLLVDAELLAEVKKLTGGLSARLETEIEAKAEAKRLFAAQREECPPAYRRFVNRYFEALSQVKPSAETGGKK